MGSLGDASLLFIPVPVRILQLEFMIAVVQRVTQAHVEVSGEIVGSIGAGLLVLLGIDKDDADQDLEYICSKLLNLRIFPDESGRMNRSLLEFGGAVLLVSQFTLLGNVRKGRRPNFTNAAAPHIAEAMYLKAAETLRHQVEVATGVFGASMNVSLVNEGPVTLILESPRE